MWIFIYQPHCQMPYFAQLNKQQSFMQFRDVIGQEATKQHLAEMVEQNRLSHALLFLGKEGSGVLPLALAFAQYIVSLPQASPVVEDLFGGMTAL